MTALVFYRIADSSILRTDSLLNIKKEDGLQVLVYVNDTQIGAAQNVAPGLLTSFDRELGQLNIGDTVWVMISALKNQAEDAFSNFDFTLHKWGPVVQDQFAAMMSFDSGMQMGAVPEPASATLLLVALPLFWPRRSRHSHHDIAARLFGFDRGGGRRAMPQKSLVR